MKAHGSTLGARVREFQIGGELFRFNSNRYLMGVVNLSPDSWYRESVCLSTEAAIRRAQVLRSQGAHVIDVGAESTLSHAARIGDFAQNSKLLPVVRALVELGICVSVETYEPSVVRACLEAGAEIINLTGTVHFAEILPIVREHGGTIILCYVEGDHVRDVGDFNLREDPIPRMEGWFRRQIDTAVASGVENLIIDPGLGFYYQNLQDSAVRVRHQMRTFLHTFRLRTLGFPVCHALPHAFEYFGEEVRCAEPFFAVLAALGKTDLFRTHEVARVKAVLDTLSSY